MKRSTPSPQPRSSPLLEETRSALRAFGLRPRKVLGQNFLTDRDALLTVADSAFLTRADTVLEVGPGVGVLTLELAERAGSVVSVEVDEALAALVLRRFIDQPHVTVVCANILHANLDAMLPYNQPFKVVANIPYYLTAPLLRLFLEGAHRPTHMVLMVQKEVAERLAARPGNMSLLSVSAQIYSVPEIVRLVPASSFYPMPEVASAVVRLTRRPQPLVTPDNLEFFFRVARAGFHDRRKQLHNALANGLPIPPAQIDAALTEAAIDHRRRAETLGLDEWATLVDVLRPYALAAHAISTRTRRSAVLRTEDRET